MSSVPTWPIVAGALVVGLAGEFWIERTRLGAKIDRIEAEHAEQERVRQVQRAADETAARKKEQDLAQRASQIEQEKTDEIAAVRSSADALIDRLRKQAASKPTVAGRVPAPSATCPAEPRPAVSERSGEAVVRLAERADEVRAGLAACYKWADSVMGVLPQERPAEERQDN